MSAQEVIAELSRLSRPDLAEVDARLHELLRHNGGGSSVAEQRLREAAEPSTDLAASADPTAGGLLAYLEEHCLGVPLITPERRAMLRAGRGRRSNRRL